jgi:hypothetical protein
MKRLNTIVIAASIACALAATPARALDPLSLIVLRMLRDHVISSQLEAAFAPGEAQHPAPSMQKYPRDLKGLVDQGFPHLDAGQRRAVHDRLSEMMNDPQHAAQRDLILNEFIRGASAARRAHQTLATLTDEQKRTIAVEAAAAYRGKEPEALQEAIGLLRSSAVPIPSDLRELMLAEFTAESARTLPR